MSTEVPRSRVAVLGLGCAAACFVAVTGFLGFTMGAEFVDSTVFSKVYGVFVMGVSLVPLLAWRGPGGQRRDPGFGRAAWLPLLYIAAHGVAYSHGRGASNVIVVALGWGAFAFAGTVAMYTLGQQLAAGKASSDVPGDASTSS